MPSHIASVQRIATILFRVLVRLQCARKVSTDTVVLSAAAAPTTPRVTRTLECVGARPAGLERNAINVRIYYPRPVCVWDCMRVESAACLSQHGITQNVVDGFRWIFLPRDALRKRGLCCLRVSLRLSVCHVTRVRVLYPNGYHNGAGPQRSSIFEVPFYLYAHRLMLWWRNTKFDVV